VARGKDTPGHKYKNINYDAVRPKTAAAKYFPIEKMVKVPPKTDIRYKKSKDPGPGSYETEKAITKTQWNGESYIQWKLMKDRTNFIDTEVKTKKSVPGVGSYKDLERGYRSLSTMPTSLRKRR
jgi:hypothetical protein